MLIKDEQIEKLRKNLEKKKNEVFTLEDENIQLRRKLAEKPKLKSSGIIDRDLDMGQLIGEENIQLEVERLNSKIEELTRDKHRIEDQYKDKLDEKEL